MVIKYKIIFIFKIFIFFFFFFFFLNSGVNCFYECNNSFHMFTIRVCKLETNKKVGHLQMEFSSILEQFKAFLDRGRVFQAKLTSTHCRWSVLVKRWKWNFTWDNNKVNKGQMYYGTDPFTEEILGYFLAIQHNFEKDEVETTAQLDLRY